MSYPRVYVVRARLPSARAAKLVGLGLQQPPSISSTDSRTTSSTCGQIFYSPIVITPENSASLAFSDTTLMLALPCW